MKIYALALSLLISQTLLAWSQTGHRVVGLIAEGQLSPKARAQVVALLPGESLAEVSNWADEVRSDPAYRHMEKWHYVDYPIGSHYDPQTANKQGDVLKAIQDLSAKLGRSIPAAERSEALKLLVHFVGDLHQPFHVGNGKDAGGNLCDVLWFGEPTNLHFIWDEKMIDSTRLSFTEFTGFLGKPSAAQVQAWSKGTPNDWAEEIPVFREQLYPASLGVTLAAGAVELPQKRTYCRSGFEMPETPNAKRPALGFDYRYQFLPRAKEQMHKAGVRLAFLLNGILK
ncbi:S1/P1 nuclease [bacterium]|nr:S1/P1 nuclease [bacterium]